ncbi:SDR family NAD(P)-dependent oxidoreductase [bacterium]|nr:SDR family NAD(P)-dependent oxidoreductase [bacterium]
MKNRICLVTGGTSGVGRAIAAGLTELGAIVIIVSKSAERGAAAVKDFRRKTGNSQTFYRTLDLEKPDRIPRFVEQFRQEFQTLHVLSNNAAVFPRKTEFTPGGMEKIFAVNYLAHFVLTYSLLDLLKSSAPSRILIVSGSPSILKYGKINMDDMPPKKPVHPFRATYLAALAKVAFSYELARRLEGSGVTSNTFHPGLVKTNLTRHFPWIFRIPVSLAQIFFSQRCDTGVYLASSHEVEGITSQFFKRKKIVSFHPKQPLEAYASELWEKSKQWTGLK